MLRSDYENFSQKLVQKLGKTVTMDENAFFFERESMGSKNCKRLGSVVCRQFDATYDDSCRDKYYVGVASVKDEEEREHLLKSYSIGELIIKRNFFSNK